MHHELGTNPCSGSGREKKDLHVVWLDSANAYGSVPYQLIAFAMDLFYIPEIIRVLVTSYFQDLHMCFMLPNHPIMYLQLEVRIAMRCSIALILFITAFEVIMIRARQEVGTVHLPARQRLPPLRSYVDDIACYKVHYECCGSWTDSMSW